MIVAVVSLDAERAFSLTDNVASNRRHALLIKNISAHGNEAIRKTFNTEQMKTLYERV
jgi:hypothetical protein